MERLLDFVLLLLSQFAGGPGPVENNLVRFGLPAVLWAILLYIAWSRQRTQDLPREKLLVWGFGLALVRELAMFGQMAYRLLGSGNVEAHCEVIQTLEHGLAMAAMVVVAGAFLNYILEDPKFARRYLQAGIGITVLVFVLASWIWWYQLATYPHIKFHQSWAAWLFHVPLSLLMGVALFSLLQESGWLRNVVAAALTLELISEILLLLNYATARAYNTVICPIGNSLHILAIPLLGFVYLREQSIEKKHAEEALLAYRDHLEELVHERTTEIALRNASLATQNVVAATLSQSLQIEENLKKVLQTVQDDVGMQIGLIFLMDSDSEDLSLYLHSGLSPSYDIQILTADKCACQQISQRALFCKGAIVANPLEFVPASQAPCIKQAGIYNLLSVPLVSKGSAIGVMTLGTSQTVSIPSHKLELLTAIGQQIGMAIENARLYKDAEDWAGELTRLHESSSYLASSFDFNQVYAEIARQSARLMKCQKACVIHVNEHSGKFELAADFGFEVQELQFLQKLLPEWPLLTDLANQARTTTIQNAAFDRRLPQRLTKKLKLQAALFEPIWRSEHPQEFIVLFDVQATRQWNAREIELIGNLANRAAVALVNANLHHQLELAAALEERQRIAANMHDGLAQTLSLLGLRVDRMQALIEGGEFSPEGTHPEFEAVTHEIRNVISSVSTEVRRSIASLQEAPRPRSSLQDLVRDLLEKQHNGDEPQLRFDPEPNQAFYVPPDQTDQVMRVVQEAIVNACRHAQAQTISVRLENAYEQIRITIEDDGCGFDLDKPPQDGDHFGLSIMQARAAHIGADFQIDTSPGRGTRIILAWTPESGEIAKSKTLQQKIRLQAWSEL
jgi:nitrate/nitrite-specific signal transduction histidine kinase